MSGSRAATPWMKRSANPKLDRVMVTPEGVPLNVTIAPAGARVGALLLDLVMIQLISMFIALLCIVLAIPFLDGETDFQNLDGPLGLIAVFYLIATFLLLNGYFIFFELGYKSATWGKRAVGIRVASRDGSRLTAEAVIARNIVRSVELFLPLTFLGSVEAGGSLVDLTAWAGLLWLLMFMLFPLFNKDRLRGGDVIAGTWVVQDVKKNLGDIVAPSALAPRGPRPPQAINFPMKICRFTANMNCRRWKMSCAATRKRRWKKWPPLSARKSAGNRAVATSVSSSRLIIPRCAPGWNAA
ncbi:RDD family protein [Sphingopyxis sp. BSNA05]|uniref:RDD family protein n=1 Tax=Sphingopyxis sp. BSNA05 TaxID=1236614 RepID=UPI0020B6486C|nr:RDD family protein [Sphingopyxis sp. BSNA05]